MALDQAAYSGRDITITFDGGVTRWKSYSMSINRATTDASGADSDYDEVLRTRKMMEITLTGLVGANVSTERNFSTSPGGGTTLPDEGDVITDWDVAAGADTILPDITEFENIRVLTMRLTGDEGAQQWELTARSGVLN